MAKISKRIETEETVLNPDSYKKTISKSLVDANVTNEIKKVENNPIESSLPEGTDAADAICKWLLSTFGEQVFESVKNNKNFAVPYQYELTTEEWLDNRLRTVFELQGLDSIYNSIQTKFKQIADEVDALKSENKKLKSDMFEIEKKSETVRKEKEEIVLKKVEIEKQFKKTIGFQEILASVLYHPDGSATIMDLILESIENEEVDASKFVEKFVRFWLPLRESMVEKYADESKKVDAVQLKIRDLMMGISGLYFPQRRPILDMVAKIISSHFELFMFVSPEETLQVEPEIHNAKGLGGNTVKEGISFAVLRKENRVTYQYADIKVG